MYLYYSHEQRVQLVLVRAEFDKNRNIKDPIKAKRALEAAEIYYEYVKHPEPIKCKLCNAV